MKRVITADVIVGNQSGKQTESRAQLSSCCCLSAAAAACCVVGPVVSTASRAQEQQ